MKIKCKICKHRFQPKKENKYTVTQTPNVGLSFVNAKVFEAFDCPMCGCQNLVGIREGSAKHE